MALPIQSPPTLTGESARKFIETADLAYQNRGTVDMSRGKAIYVSCEDDEKELHIRLADIAQAEGWEISDLENLIVRPPSATARTIDLLISHWCATGATLC